MRNPETHSLSLRKCVQFMEKNRKKAVERSGCEAESVGVVCDVLRIQKHIIRILLMPVIYAIDCYASLVWHDGHMYLHLIREQYEAYTVWSFQVRPF